MSEQAEPEHAEPEHAEPSVARGCGDPVTRDEVVTAYGSRARGLAAMLGTRVDPQDPDRAIVEAWAAAVRGPILDVGSGTGRWAGLLAELGHTVEGLEPAAEFVEIARRAHPAVPFRSGAIADLDGPADAGRWSGILAWYSLIHLGPEEMPAALALLRRALAEDGSMLVSFFTGARLEPFAHPVAPAYRWPAHDLIDALTAAGLVVTGHRTHPGGQHASVSAAPAATPAPTP